MSSTCSSRRELGRTGIEVSTVSMGCWAIVGDATWGAQDETDALESIRAAIDSGINFFDSAEGYGGGLSEELLPRGLGNDRDQVVLASKVSPSHAGSRDQLFKACEDSLARLKTDYLDVYYLHWPNRSTPMPDLVAWFEELREAGKIRCFAVSNFGCGDLSDLLECGRPEANQLPYNLLWRVIEKEIVPVCQRNEISVTCYSPIAQGLLTGKFSSLDDVPEGRARTRHFSSERPQARHEEAGCEAETSAAIEAIKRVAEEVGCPMVELALAWLVHQPGVASVIVGIRSVAQAETNARAMTRCLSPEVVQRLCSLTNEIKNRFGTNPDMWQSKTRYR